MKSSLWVELQCLNCHLKDRLPLEQFLEYESYSCPYQRGERKCAGRSKLLRIRNLTFREQNQPTLF